MNRIKLALRRAELRRNYLNLVAEVGSEVNARILSHLWRLELYWSRFFSSCSLEVSPKALLDSALFLMVEVASNCASRDVSEVVRNEQFERFGILWRDYAESLTSLSKRPETLKNEAKACYHKFALFCAVFWDNRRRDYKIQYLLSLIDKSGLSAFLSEQKSDSIDWERQSPEGRAIFAELTALENRELLKQWYASQALLSQSAHAIHDALEKAIGEELPTAHASSKQK